MTLFLVSFALALLVSSVGFKKYVWFISIGYGLSIAAIGIGLLIGGRTVLSPATTYACALLIVYGLRLGGYLILRELRSSSYNQKMKTEIKDGRDMPLIAKCGIWVFAALLYATQTAPLAFRLAGGGETDALFVVGLVVSTCGLALETAADLQKSAAKRKNPHRFVDHGLYAFVRCPNYLGELLFWTGCFLGGITAYAGVIPWVLALVGYLGIVYVMFSGARRLEERQTRTYGADPTYRAYAQTTPIMIPFVPLYSVLKYKWLVG